MVAFTVVTVMAALVAGITALDPARPQKPGRHRPETVVEVGALYLIRHRALYEKYAPYVYRYGYGAAQGSEWARRALRRAELLAKRAARAELADYRWLAGYELAVGGVR